MSSSGKNVRIYESRQAALEAYALAAHEARGRQQP
jgi:hypothetical protein